MKPSPVRMSPQVMDTGSGIMMAHMRPCADGDYVSWSEYQKLAERLPAPPAVKEVCMACSNPAPAERGVEGWQQYRVTCERREAGEVQLSRSSRILVCPDCQRFVGSVDHLFEEIKTILCGDFNEVPDWTAEIDEAHDSEPQAAPTEAGEDCLPERLFHGAVQELKETPYPMQIRSHPDISGRFWIQQYRINPDTGVMEWVNIVGLPSFTAASAEELW